MKLLSINVGQPREVPWQGDSILTSIFKDPVAGPVAVRTMNLEGDRQSDLTVHGGARKAVYVYPSEHYPFWRGELPEQDVPYGAFGENLTTSGFLEGSVRIGDRLTIGTSEFVVTQPRMPCFKLIIRFGRPDMVKRFMKSGRSGFYLRVTREGAIETGQSIVLAARPGANATVSEVFGDRLRR